MPNTAFAQTAEEIARKAFASTVLLVMEDANGQPLSLGSGFCVGNGQLATNVHVVAGAARGYAKLVGEKTKYDIEGIVALSPEKDLVVLKISGGCSQSLALGNSDAVQVGDSVYAVGNPQGLEGTFSQGIVSGVRELGSNKLLQITAPISPGSSGGPVLNEQGEVIGVSVATFREGQNLNFAVPSIYLKELLGKAGPLMPLAKAEAQNSVRADVGGRINDRAVGIDFSWDYDSDDDYPGHSPIDFSAITYSGTIPGGLSKRLTSSTERSTRDLTRDMLSGPPSNPAEIRILDFEIVQ